MPACSRPAILRLHAACRGACEERRWSRTSASSAASRHTCDVDKPLEFVTADAPPTAASAVHFIGAAPLEDSSARWGRGAPRPRAQAFVVSLFLRAPVTYNPPYAAMEMPSR